VVGFWVIGCCVVGFRVIASNVVDGKVEGFCVVLGGETGLY